MSPRRSRSCSCVVTRASGVWGACRGYASDLVLSPHSARGTGHVDVRQIAKRPRPGPEGRWLLSPTALPLKRTVRFVVYYAANLFSVQFSPAPGPAHRTRPHAHPAARPIPTGRGKKYAPREWRENLTHRTHPQANKVNRRRLRGATRGSRASTSLKRTVSLQAPVAVAPIGGVRCH